MSASPSMVRRLQRMTNIEPGDTTWDDDILIDYIERYPLLDADGNAPDDSDWAATYDMHAAAADVWQEKAATVAEKYDFSAYDARFNQSQLQAQYLKQAAYHNARRAVDAITAQVEPPIRRGLYELWQGNQPEPEDYA